MKDDIKNNSAENSSNRRKVLKTAGVATVAGAAAWQKPMLQSMVLPAHAQTSMVSMPITLTGSSGSTSNKLALLQKENQSSSIAAKVANVLVPEANAGVQQVAGVCNALVDVDGTPDDYTHCITLSLPDGENDNGEFNITVDGPEIFYDFICNISATWYYAGSTNFSGNGSGTLRNRQFSISIGELDITGEVSEDFSEASGQLQFTGMEFEVGTSQAPGGAEASCYSGDIAYWAVDLNGGSCSPGIGVQPYYNAEVDTDFACGG